jgi:hypothetical protein
MSESAAAFSRHAVVIGRVAQLSAHQYTRLAGGMCRDTQAGNHTPRRALLPILTRRWGVVYPLHKLCV